MRKIIIVFILFLNFTNIEAQIILSEDTNFCVPQQHNLYALSAVQSSMATDDFMILLCQLVLILIFMEEHIVVV